MAWKYIDLCNRVLRRLNEVPLVPSTFNLAVGFQAAVQDSINDSLNDIYAAELNWPFLWASGTQLTTGYQNIYPLPSNYTQVDWNSFYRRSNLSADPPVQALKTQFMTFQDWQDNNKEFDEQIIDQFKSILIPTGASQVCINAVAASSPISPLAGSPIAAPDYSDYVLGTFGTNTINFLSTAGVQLGMTVFDFTTPGAVSLSPGQSSPGTGVTVIGITPTQVTLSSIINAPGVFNGDLIIFTTPQYLQGQGGAPSQVFQTQDHLNFGLSTVPDTVYQIDYEYWYKPTDLVAYSDTTVIPDRYSKVIIDGATYYSYMFRDNAEEAAAVEKKFISGISQMRTELINRQLYMRSDNIQRGNYSTVGFV